MLSGTAVYPHRKLWEEISILPSSHAGAVNGGWVDYKFWASSAAVFRIEVGAIAGIVNFTFETTTDDGTGTPTVADIVQMGNCDICSTSLTFADGILTVDPALDPHLTDGKVTGFIVLCCPARYVRAVSDAAGDYSVSVTGLAKNLARA